MAADINVFYDNIKGTITRKMEKLENSIEGKCIVCFVY